MPLSQPFRWLDCFGIHDKSIALPLNVWTPIPLFTDESSDGTQSLLHPINSVANSVGSGSNTLVLPQGTINIQPGGIAALAAGQPAVPSANLPAGVLPTSGDIVINGPPGANIDTIISYTGYSIGTGTGGQDQFTGCTRGTGTLATGQVVRMANDLIFPPIGALMGDLGICVTFPALATGVIGVRLFSSPFAVGSSMCPAPGAVCTLSVTPPPGPPNFVAPGGSLVAQMICTGAAVTIAKDAIQAPSFGGGFWF